jgi:hypothetical protein
MRDGNTQSGTCGRQTLPGTLAIIPQRPRSS